MSEAIVVNRNKEIRKLADQFLLWDTDPNSLLDGFYPDLNREFEEIQKVNSRNDFIIYPEEVAKVMKDLMAKQRIRDQIKEREDAIRKPLARVPYRDWLAGMIFSGHTVDAKTAVECADLLIRELYPVEGETDENSRN